MNAQDNYWGAESAAKEMDRLKEELASKQTEIDNWKIVAEDWRVKAVDWSRKNAELEKRLRLIALEEYEKIPVEPIEVYSPNTIVIDDKCRKCAGQMRDGKAIEQTATGYPDFIGGSIVTMSSGGPGKIIDCMKCSDCGWSAMK